MGSRWWLLPLLQVLLGVAFSYHGADSGDEFDQLLKTSVQDLKVKRQANQAWGIDTFI